MISIHSAAGQFKIRTDTYRYEARVLSRERKKKTRRVDRPSTVCKQTRDRTALSKDIYKYKCKGERERERNAV